MEKNEDAFRTISEVADDLDLPQHVLRFWETRFTQIRPLKRAGGRRYYRPTDVVLLRTIRSLLYDQGYTIKGVQKLLKEQGARQLRSPGTLAPEAAAGPRQPAGLFDETEDADAEPTVSDFEGNLSVLLTGDRKALMDALAIIEECERILRTVLPPRAAG